MKGSAKLGVSEARRCVFTVEAIVMLVVVELLVYIRLKKQHSQAQIKAYRESEFKCKRPMKKRSTSNRMWLFLDSS